MPLRQEVMIEEAGDSDDALMDVDAAEPSQDGDPDDSQLQAGPGRRQIHMGMVLRTFLQDLTCKDPTVLGGMGTRRAANC